MINAERRVVVKAQRFEDKANEKLKEMQNIKFFTKGSDIR